MRRAAIVIGMLVLALAMQAQAASATSAWNPAAAEVTPPAGADPEFPFAKLEAVSCGAPGYCSATGGYFDLEGERQMMVVDQVDGVWQQAQKISVPSGHEYPVLDRISCPSAGNCTATGVIDIGSESQGVIVSSQNGTWGTAQILPEPSGATWTWIADVSCPADGECVAVGGFEENPSELPSAPIHPFAVIESGGTWGAAVPIAVSGSPEISTLGEVDCPSTGNCSAHGSSESTKPIVASLSGGVWSTATELAAPGPGLHFIASDLSCGAAGSCVIAGTYAEGGKQRPAVAAQIAGTWGAPTPLTLPSDVAAVNSKSSLDAVSCTATGSCTALGDYLNSSGEKKAFAATEVSGTWQQAVQVPVDVPVEPSFPYAMGWNEIDCFSAQSCGATGFAYFHGTTALEEGGSWGAGATPIVLPDNAQSQEAGFLNSMSCGGAGACAAVGGFVDTEGMERAMVLSTEDQAESGEDPEGEGGASSGSSGPSPMGAGLGLKSPPRGAARLSASAAFVKGGVARVPLKCPGSGEACSGVLELLAKPSAGAAGSSIPARAGQAKILVGKKAFGVGAGKKATIRVPLTKRGKALLKSSGKHGLRVTLVGSGVAQRSLLLKSSSATGAARRAGYVVTSSIADLKTRCVAAGTATPKILADGTWLNHPGDRKTQTFTAEAEYKPLPADCEGAFQRIPIIKFQIQNPTSHADWNDAGRYLTPKKSQDVREEDLEQLEEEREAQGKSCWVPIPGGEKNTCRTDPRITSRGGAGGVYFHPPRRLHEPSYSRHDPRLYRCTPGKGITRVRALFKSTITNATGKVVAQRIAILPVRVRHYPGSGPMPKAWRGAVRGPC